MEPTRSQHKLESEVEVRSCKPPFITTDIKRTIRTTPTTFTCHEGFYHDTRPFERYRDHVGHCQRPRPYAAAPPADMHFATASSILEMTVWTVAIDLSKAVFWV
jgi:hypothetical protein